MLAFKVNYRCCTLFFLRISQPLCLHFSSCACILCVATISFTLIYNNQTLFPLVIITGGLYCFLFQVTSQRWPANHVASHSRDNQSQAAPTCDVMSRPPMAFILYSISYLLLLLLLPLLFFYNYIFSSLVL